MDSVLALGLMGNTEISANDCVFRRTDWEIDWRTADARRGVRCNGNRTGEEPARRRRYEAAARQHRRNGTNIGTDIGADIKAGRPRIDRFRYGEAEWFRCL
jgi:hypothetical protein